MAQPKPAPPPSPPPDPSCDTCRYWQVEHDDKAFGSCRRRCAVMCGTGGFAMWHRTLCDDWCGEWEGRS